MKNLKKLAITAICMVLCVSMSSCTLLFRYLQSSEKTPSEESFKGVIILPDDGLLEDVSISVELVPEVESKQVLNIEKLWQSETEMEKAEIYTFEEEFYDDTEIISYTYTADADGVLSAWITEMYAGNVAWMYIKDEYGEEIVSDYVDKNGYGISADVKAGNTYYIDVEAGYSAFTFTLNIGVPNMFSDISGYTIVYDSTEYINQENRYIFTPEIDGIYRFDFYEVMNDCGLEFRVTNRLGETLCESYNLGNGEGATIFEAVAGERYTVTVSQSIGYTDYKMQIGYQKETADIMGYDIVNDSIEYADQINYYTFWPKGDNATLVLEEIQNGCLMGIHVYNYLGETIAYDYSAENGTYLKLQGLNNDKPYVIAITHQVGTSDYSLIIE